MPARMVDKVDTNGKIIWKRSAEEQVFGDNGAKIDFLRRSRYCHELFGMHINYLYNIIILILYYTNTAILYFKLTHFNLQYSKFPLGQLTQV